MKKIYILVLFAFVVNYGWSQEMPLKQRADAFPSVVENSSSKSVQMASSVSEMANWNRYPTYETYLAMMQKWAEDFPTLCHVDTIGTSVQGRLILSMYIEKQTDDEMYRPEFFYSSTMHGDEVTGYVMMLRLIDTLLNGYGSNPQYTNLIDGTRISINPLSNPDGTYRGGNDNVRYAMRYNANYVDLNRNYPDPFGTLPLSSQQRENTAMINYFNDHNFRLSANIHGGAEVMNYPWDSFTTDENPHPDRAWWIDVSRRFVDTSRTYSNNHFRDTYSSGITAGGDWYVISNGRQDYVNYYHNCREMTMEISSDKMIDSEQLPEYWRFLQHSLVNYIEEIHSNDLVVGVNEVKYNNSIKCYPNPTHDKVFLSEEPLDDVLVFNMQGQRVAQLPASTRVIDMSSLPKGIYLLRTGNKIAKIVRR